MILIAEHGLHFRREGDRWRCVEHPALELLPGGVYLIGDRRFPDVADALAEVKMAEARERSGRPD